jgi:hypothetical protein
LRHRPLEAVLLSVVITTAPTALTLGLALRGVTDNDGPLPMTSAQMAHLVDEFARD